LSWEDAQIEDVVQGVICIQTDMQEAVFPHPTVSEIFKETSNIF
jgi:hypothetical protein